jgi:ABC-2 type transport system ATP-binding protein
MPEGPAATLLECRGLTKRFGSRVALEGLDLAISAGEVVGYLGPNGAGKTTTLRLLGGALRPSAGGARLLGADCWRERRLAHRSLGYLPSDPFFEPRLTGHEVLAQSARLRGRRPAAAEPAQLALAAELDLELDRPVGQLSRGNRQKLAVLIAFWHQPDVLLLDEPTTGLDPLAQEILHQFIRAAVDRGAAVLLSSHVLAEVEAIAERVVVLRAGHAVADRSVTELAASAPHRLTVTLQNPADAGVLDAVPGVQELRRAGATVECSVPRHSLQAAIRALCDVEISDIRIHEAELEDWFRGLYTIDDPAPEKAGGDLR